MADIDVITKCSVCSMDYQETGDQRPVALPCSHTFCFLCVGKNDSTDSKKIQCYHCEKAYQISKIEFTLNMGIWLYIHFKGNDTCAAHDKPAVFFCRHPRCQKGICVTCVVKEHKPHDFVEMIDEKEELQAALTKNIGTSIAELEKYKEELTNKKIALDACNTTCLEELKEKKKEILQRIRKTFQDK